MWLHFQTILWIKFWDTIDENWRLFYYEICVWNMNCIRFGTFCKSKLFFRKFLLLFNHSEKVLLRELLKSLQNPGVRNMIYMYRYIVPLNLLRNKMWRMKEPVECHFYHVNLISIIVHIKEQGGIKLLILVLNTGQI